MEIENTFGATPALSFKYQELLKICWHPQSRNGALNTQKKQSSQTKLKFG
jgi:hypothetical protein